MTSFYKRQRVSDKAYCFESRISYLDKIVKGLQFTPQLFPRPDQERLYQKALAHVAQVLSVETCSSSISGTAVSGNEDGCCNKNEYVQIMKNILNKLRIMERGRLYDPPSDHEIVYYLLIKKYSRPIFTFHESQSWASDQCGKHECGWNQNRRGLPCFSPFPLLHFVEELGEVNSYMEHISAKLSEVTIQHGCSVKPLLEISKMGKDESTPLVCGSKERSNIFYRHKFMLALIDLRSSQHAFSPPSQEEKECFDQVLFDIEPPSPQPLKDKDVFPHNLHDLYVERLRGGTVCFEKNCTRIALEIVKKVSICFSDEALLEFCFSYDRNANEQDETVVNCYREMVKKCSIPCNDLPNYIGKLGQAIKILVYILHLNGGLLTLSSAVDKLLRGFSDDHFVSEGSSCDKSQLKNIGWEAFHALTLFKHGCSFPVMEFAKRETMLKYFNQGINKPNLAKGTNGNVETLKGILEELRGVEDWDSQPPPTYEDSQVFRQVWRSIVCSIHFFNCTMAYQQRTNLVDIGQLNAARTMSEEKIYIGHLLRREISCLVGSPLAFVNKSISILIFILQGFRDGLLEKLERLQK